MMVLGAVSVGCGATHDATVRYELALSSPAADAAQRAKRRVEKVDGREGVSVGEVSVAPSAKGLEVTAKVAAGEACASFERARALIGEALVEQRRMTLHVARRGDSVSIVEGLRAALGDEVEVRGSDEGMAATVKAREGLDLAPALRGLSDKERLVVSEYIADETGSRGPRHVVWSLEPKAALGVDEIQSARAGEVEQTGQPSLFVTLTAEGATRFAELTGGMVGGYLAILIDGVPASVPKVMTRIDGGQLQVILGAPWLEGGGARAMEQARALAAAIAEPPIAERVTIEEDGSSCPASGSGAP